MSKVTARYPWFRKEEDDVRQLGLRISERLVAYYLFLAIFVTRHQIDCFHMSHVHLVSKNIRENDFGEIFLLLITVKIAFCSEV
jgi:hypothetical protein